MLRGIKRRLMLVVVSVNNFLKRFFDKVKFRKDGCWIWTGCRTKESGYGRIWYNGRMYVSHRILYTLFVDDVQESLVLDHKCKNKICVNPRHLRQITNRENVLIGIGPTAMNYRKKSCKNGHEFTKENTRIKKDKSRYCRKCANVWKRLSRERIIKRMNLATADTKESK